MYKQFLFHFASLIFADFSVSLNAACRWFSTFWCLKLWDLPALFVDNTCSVSYYGALAIIHNSSILYLLPDINAFFYMIAEVTIKLHDSAQTDLLSVFQCIWFTSTVSEHLLHRIWVIIYWDITIFLYFHPFYPFIHFIQFLISN